MSQHQQQSNTSRVLDWNFVGICRTQQPTHPVSSVIVSASEWGGLSVFSLMKINGLKSQFFVLNEASVCFYKKIKILNNFGLMKIKLDGLAKHGLNSKWDQFIWCISSKKACSIHNGPITSIFSSASIYMEPISLFCKPTHTEHQ